MQPRELVERYEEVLNLAAQLANEAADDPNVGMQMKRILAIHSSLAHRRVMLNEKLSPGAKEAAARAEYFGRIEAIPDEEAMIAQLLDDENGPDQ